MSTEEFARYFEGKHAAIARNLPGLRRYLVNIVRSHVKRETEYDGVAKLWFDDRESMKNAFASLEGEKTQRDAEQFAATMVTSFVDEHEILPAHTASSS